MERVQGMDGVRRSGEASEQGAGQIVHTLTLEGRLEGRDVGIADGCDEGIEVGWLVGVCSRTTHNGRGEESEQGHVGGVQQRGGGVR